LSTTTVCPRLSVNFAPTPRAMVSIAPPAASGTISRMGRVGYCCACAGDNTDASAAHSNINDER
jgi:predicted lysophospholipase L1 biosynthesis ABC-type transport system permease subunit